MKVVADVLTILLFLNPTFSQDDPPDYTWDDLTMLDEYVNREDPTFQWEQLEMFEYNDTKLYTVNMTSQTWLDESLVDRPVWWHYMGIAIPDDPLTYDTGFLFIDGGNNNGDGLEPPGRLDAFNLIIRDLASETGLVCAYLRQVPNQPMVFANDPEQKSRREDSIIAFSWWWPLQYLTNGEEPPTYDMVLRNPMTKAGKRGLDTIAELTQSIDPEFNIEKFVVSGASKRGWTAWSLAATDQRVIATAPIVFSMLYAEKTFMNHYRAMDQGWSFAFGPYYNQNLTYYLLETAAEPLYDIEDMIRYRSRLELIPKLLILATGDEFFLNQDTHSWWNMMGGTKHIMMNANAEHALFPHWVKVYDTLSAWMQTLIYDGPENLPVVTWEREQVSDSAGRITYHADPPPVEVKGWRAVTSENTTMRDYRVFRGHPDHVFQRECLWFDYEVQQLNETTFVMEVPTVEDEWVGFFIEGRWESDRLPADRVMRLTSEVNISPDTFPAEPCTTPEECYGELK